MDINIITVFAVIVVTAGLFVWGKIRSDIVALCALLALILFGIITPEEGLSGFSNSVVIMMGCLFIIGGGIFQTGLAKMISTKLLSLARNNERKLFVLVMLATGSFGAFISNTGTVALMLPIVISLTAEANTDPRRFLMPIAFGSSLGLFTLISTPPNLIINDTLISNGFKELSFFSFLPIGVITLLIGIIVLWPLSKLLVSKSGGSKTKKNKDKSLQELEMKYKLASNLYRLSVNKSSKFIDKSLQELNITQKYGVSILEIRRSVSKNHFHKSVITSIAGPSSTLKEHDILYVYGGFENIQQLALDNNLKMVDINETEKEMVSVSHVGGMAFQEIGIAEVVLMSTSNLINKPIKESNFRQQFNVNILGIQREKGLILKDIKDERMRSGDVLLVQGEWENIERLNQETSEWVVVGQPLEMAQKVPINQKAPIAATIMLLMVISMVFNIIPSVISTMLAAILMILLGCFRNVESAYKTINWESIFLFAGMFPLAIAMEKTGASELIAHNIVSGLSQYGPVSVLAGIYLATSVLTMFISNTATAVLFAPIAYQSAMAIDASPMPFLFSVAIASSMCFTSPFSTPPNALVMSAGRYTFMDYVKVGLPLQVIIGIVMVLVLPLIFPF